MATLESIIQQIEVELDLATKREARAGAEITTILARAENEGRPTLSEEEDADVKAAFDKRRRAQRDIEGIKGKLAHARRNLEEERAIDARMEERNETPGAQEHRLPAYDKVHRVGREERTYHQGNTRQGGPFLRDVMMAFLYRDPSAEGRLIQHMREEQVERGQYLTRAVGTGAFAGLVVPQYLTEMYAPAVAANRPFADACNKHPLPADGMTVNISRITTATGAALQATENSAVQETNADDTLLTINVQTAAGQQTVSRQAIDRGTGVEEVLTQDLLKRYNTVLDSTLINQATTGLAAVSTVVAYTDLTPTGPEAYPKILAAAAGSEAALLGSANPDLAIMHSRRWYWFNAQMTTSWPMLQQPGLAVQAAGENLGQTYGRGVRGVLPNGLVVIVDNNIAVNVGAGTNEDEIYVAPRDECHLWEDPNAPVFIRAEQTAVSSLGVVLVMYGYFAYTFQRYANSHQKVQGTGLVTPAF